jgi:hypothetical protein
MAEAFLARYPFYAEAYKFRAQMLLVKERNREALRSLKAAKEIDEWKVYGFDEAEAQYGAGAVDEAVRVLMAQIGSLLEAIQSGTHIFLIGTMISPAAQERSNARCARKSCVWSRAGHVASRGTELPRC